MFYVVCLCATFIAGIVLSFFASYLLDELKDSYYHSVAKTAANLSGEKVLKAISTQLLIEELASREDINNPLPQKPIKVRVSGSMYYDEEHDVAIDFSNFNPLSEKQKKEIIASLTPVIIADNAKRAKRSKK